MGYPKIYEAEINQYFYVLKDALPEDGASKTQLYQSSIRHQLIHTFPNMHLFQDDKSMLMGSYDLRKLETNILKEEEVSLGFDIFQPRLEAPPYFGPIVQDYIAKSLRLKVPLKGQKLLKVSYQLKVPIELCQSQDSDLKTLKLPMPLDPWLTYFYLNPENKIERELKNVMKLKVNPCTTRPLIDPVLKETYWVMWYFWNPFQRNSNEESEFDCSKHYIKDTHWRYADISLKPLELKTATPDLARLKNKNKLKMSFIYSSFKGRSFRKIEGQLANDIEETYKKILNNIEFAEAKNLFYTKFNGQDDSLAMIGVLLFNLSHNAILKKSNIIINPYAVKIKIEGILKLSAKPFDMTIYLSTNMEEHRSDVPFNDEVARSLIEDDVVTITTHSVFGIALQLGLKKAREQAQNPKRPKYQFVSLLSCLARNYFQPIHLPAPQKDQTIDYVYSLTTLTESYGIGALTMIGMIDHAMRFGKAPLFESWLKNTKYNNFLSFEKVTHTP